jgi:hypothetical protein
MPNYQISNQNKSLRRMKKIYFYIFIILIALAYFYALNQVKISELIVIKEANNKYLCKEKDIFINCCKTNITGLVFFGRKQNVEILIKYLKVNLRKNGGILDRIKFAVKTKNKDDLDYLNELIKLNPNEFSRTEFDPDNKNAFASMYDLIKDDEYFFKIDDDIIFIKNGTFENMFIEYSSKNHMFLSANVVNHPRLSDVHAVHGAIQPDCNISFCDYSKISFCAEGPISFNNWWKEVDCARLAHESFFENFDKNNLKVYDFGLWDFHHIDFHRYSINFFLSQGKYVNRISKDYFNTKHQGDDEFIISHLIPKKTNVHTFSLGKTLVCHYSYFSTVDGLRKLDHILVKYKKISETYLK